MSVEFDRGSPGKFDTRTLSRETLSSWTGRRSYVCMQRVVKQLSQLTCDETRERERERGRERGRQGERESEGEGECKLSCATEAPPEYI